MREYFVKASIEEKGPYAESQLRAMWNSGLLTSDTVFRENGKPHWQPLPRLLEPDDRQLPPEHSQAASKPGLSAFENPPPAAEHPSSAPGNGSQASERSSPGPESRATVTQSRPKAPENAAIGPENQPPMSVFPASAPSTLPASPGRRTSPLLICGVGCFLIGLLFGLLIPFVSKQQDQNRRAECLENLRYINAAMETWALNNHKPGAAPRWADLTGYLPADRAMKCPSGGTYSIKQVGLPPECTVHGHVEQAEQAQEQHPLHQSSLADAPPR